MPSATITVKYVNPPKPGAQKGSVKDINGDYYSVWADKIGQYQPNATYIIDYDEDTGRDGRVWKTIRSHTSNGVPPTPAPSSGGYSGPRRSAGNTYRETSQRDAERMFVCSLLNASIRAGVVGINATDLVPAVNALRDTWDATFGAEDQQKPQQAA